MNLRYLSVFLRTARVNVSAFGGRWHKIRRLRDEIRRRQLPQPKRRKNKTTMETWCGNSNVRAAMLFRMASRHVSRAPWFAICEYVLR